jgi:deazaflavin-dependent oxidoreductase (nitroreductase family)
MWFMNKIANPLVRLILRSPLHGLMSAALLLITYRGRKSGKEFTLPVQYAQDGRTLYIIPGMPQQKTWWRNLKGGAPVQVSLRGQIMAGEALLLDAQTDAAEIAAGLELYLRRFPGLAKAYPVRPAANGSFAADDLHRAVTSLVMIRVTLDERNTP